MDKFEGYFNTIYAYNKFVEETATNDYNCVVTQTGCIGMCKLEPIVEVFVPGQEKVTYVEVNPEKAKQIIASHVVNGNVCQDYLIKE